MKAEAPVGALITGQETPQPRPGFWAKRRSNYRQDQLVVAQTSRSPRSNRFVIEGGLGFGWGPAGIQANVGMDFQPKNPITGRREHDVFVAVPGVKIVAPMVTPVLGFRRRGIEKSVSIAGIGGAKGHPYRAEQIKVSPPIVGLAVGKELSGFKLEAPLALLAPLASLVGAHDVVSYIHSLGLYGYFIKPQLVVNFQNERIQNRVAKISARIPQPQIKERYNDWKNKRSGPTIEEEAEKLIAEIEKTIPEPAPIL